MTLTSVLTDVARLLEREQVPYMLIGGLAVLVWGEPRATIDIDVTVDVSTGNLPSFARSVSEIGTPVPDDDPIGFADRNRVLPIRTPDGIGVDFILATLSFELDAIGRAPIIDFEGTAIRVCTAEDLIVHKIVSERARDHGDVVGVLRRQATRLDIAALDRMIERMAEELGESEIADRYRRAKSDAGFR